MDALDPSTQRVLVQILTTWVLFAVFALSAIAFVATVFGIMKPDKGTKAYLFGLFSVSAVGILVAAASDFLRANPEAAAKQISIVTEREVAANLVRDQAPGDNKKRITIFTQLSNDKGKQIYQEVKEHLSKTRYFVTSPEMMKSPIAKTEIRYCNPSNEKDAEDLAMKLAHAGLTAIPITKITHCNGEKNLNILELWVK